MRAKYRTATLWWYLGNPMPSLFFCQPDGCYLALSILWDIQHTCVDVRVDVFIDELAWTARSCNVTNQDVAVVATRFHNWSKQIQCPLPAHRARLSTSWDCVTSRISVYRWTNIWISLFCFRHAIFSCACFIPVVAIAMIKWRANEGNVTDVTYFHIMMNGGTVFYLM